MSTTLPLKEILPHATQVAPRILLAKVGLDGHDRGIRVVARGLRDSGFHVIYGGMWQTPASVAQAAVDEDVDWLGLSLLSGAHLTLVPRVLESLQQYQADIPMVVGGIIPEADVPQLKEMGVKAVFGPATSIESISKFVRSAESPHPPQVERISRADSNDLLRRRTLSQTLSALSQGQSISSRQTLAAKRTIQVVGVTGSAGVGKSSTIAALLRQFRNEGLTVAVLACDPESPITGGALLGDRIRMESHQLQLPATNACPTPDGGVFIRSLAVPSGQQAVAKHLDHMIDALDGFGFDVVLIESVGAGQGDTAIREVADQVVVLLQPDSGDSVQWEKAGLLEIADVIVVQKADLAGADRLEGEVREYLALPRVSDAPLPEVVRVSAARGQGFDALRQALRQPKT